MNQLQTVRVTLEFEQGSDPLCGRLFDGEVSYPFAGWLGLAAAVEHVLGARTQARPVPSPPSQSGGPAK